MRTAGPRDKVVNQGAVAEEADGLLLHLLRSLDLGLHDFLVPIGGWNIQMVYFLRQIKKGIFC